MERISRQRISKEIEDSNKTINQINLTDIYRTFHPTEYSFFSRAHEMFSRRDLM